MALFRNAKVTGARNDLLTIYNVGLRNAGTYECTYYDKNGTRQKSSTYLAVTSK